MLKKYSYLFAQFENLSFKNSKLEYGDFGDFVTRCGRREG